jgi:hypothetical protein
MEYRLDLSSGGSAFGSSNLGTELFGICTVCLDSLRSSLSSSCLLLFDLDEVDDDESDLSRFSFLMAIGTLNSPESADDVRFESSSILRGDGVTDRFGTVNSLGVEDSSVDAAFSSSSSNCFFNNWLTDSLIFAPDAVCGKS